MQNATLPARFHGKTKSRTSPHRPTQKEFVALVVKETGCDEITARGFDEFLARAAARCRKSHDDYIVPQDDLDRYHAVMATVMPDNRTDPRPGSAHAAANRRHLQGSELTFEHTKTDAYPHYCSVRTSIRVVS